MTSAAKPLVPPTIVQRITRALRELFRSFESERQEMESGTQATWHLTITAQVDADELDGGYVAACLEFPGAMAEGGTPEDALDALLEVVSDMIRLRAQDQIHEVIRNRPKEVVTSEPIAISI